MTWWPGWDSIDSAGSWSHFWFWFGIACLFALGASEIISHIYSLRKDELVAAAERIVTEQRNREAADAEARRKAEVDGLQKQLAEADKKVAGLQSQAIARRLTGDQTAELVKALLPFKGQKVFIWCSTAAWDATPFATDFLQAFKQAGWEPTDQIRYGIVVGGDAVGIEILVNPQMADPNGQVSMPSVVVLVNMLVGLGLMQEAALGRMAEIEAGTIYFRIGRIPPPKQ